MTQEHGNLGDFYRTVYTQRVERELPDGGIVIQTEAPRSQTYLKSGHISPSYLTLVCMQASYFVAKHAIKDLPADFADNVLFLRHRAKYLNQESTSLKLHGQIKGLRRGNLSIATIELDDCDKLSEELVVGITQKMSVPICENIIPCGQNVSKNIVEETLDIYTGERQADVTSVRYEPDTETYEAAVYFPPYSESRDLGHVSAKQMIEAMMKVALCGAAHQAHLKNLPFAYDEFLKLRLLFRTLEHDIRYRKFLATGSQSLLRYNLSFKDNACTVNFGHRQNAEKEGESFATGRMTFYLPVSS